MKKTVVKVTLSTGKVVLLREMKIKDTELAAQEVAPKSNGDSNLMQVLMQKAIVRNLLVAIDDKQLEPNEKEDMDNLFKLSEYSQLLKVIAKMSGGDDLGKEPQLEVVATGDN